VATTKSNKYKGKQQSRTSQQKTSSAPLSSKTAGISNAKKNALKISPENWKLKTGIFLLIVIATLILYSSDLHLGFFSVDDEGYVIKDPWIQKLSFENLGHIFTTPYFLNFSPLHLLSYMIDYSIAGLNAFAFHLSSNLWAGIVSGFVYLVAYAFSKKNLVAIAAALLFVAHPAHVEAVAWISSRKDLIAAAFALPSLLAYLQYRKGGKSSTKWYIVSVFLFLLAILGKVSVAIFPAIFIAVDLFVEKRSIKNSIIDKIPFAAITVMIALVVYFAQPMSGNRFDPYIFSISLGQSFWLLTGFGNYVIYRLRPQEAGMGFEIASVLFLLLLFVAPLLLKKRFPKTTVFIYWIILGLIPAQLLSFIHPVADRYLFFPSVAFVILLAWGIVSLFERISKKLIVVSSIVLALLIFLWARGTLNYLSEWNDPRSVWFAAMNKSTDPDIPYSMGGYYIDIAGRLGTTPRGERLSLEKATAIASAIWKDNPKLKDLLAEWRSGKNGGPVEKEFQNYLWSLAFDKFETASHNLGTHVLPHLLFKRGILFLDRGDLPSAKKEFLATLEETSLSSVGEIRQEVSVSTHNALGVIAWKQGDYREALKWFTMAEAEQNNFGGNWVPDISSRKQNMENIVGIISGTISPTDKRYDAESAYSLGMHYLDISNQLGTTASVKFSRDACEITAKEVWASNNQLPQLLSDWDKEQHGSITEIAFKDHLRTLAWQAFEGAAIAKGNRVMPQLFFRRGMMLGEQGNTEAARKEFLLVINEAVKDSSVAIRQQYTVTAHDALGILEWRAGNYSSARDWFQKAEDEQKNFGSIWVPDITSKKQQMEAMIKKAN
jgi:tetratricopeptide (TPR) repeat protein